MSLSRKILDNYLVDLPFIQKAAFYFLWLPLLKIGAYRRRFTTDGYKLKQQQANYYAVVGFVFAILAMIVGSSDSDAGLGTWAVGFVMALMFDIGYNRQRQIDYLRKKVDEDRDPMDEFS